MQRQEGEIMGFDQSWKNSRKPKFREVSSRFLLSPTNNNNSNNNSGPVVGDGNQSPTHNLLSPVKQKPTRSSTDNSRKLKTLENSGLIRGLWPSASSQNPSSPKVDRERETLADHLGNDRLKDLEFEHEHHKNQEKNSDSPMLFLLHRQRSCTEFTRFENEKRNAKENEKHHKPLFGSSIRYTGKFRFPRISSASSSSSSSSSSKSPKSDDYNDGFVPGRLSMDETALRKRNSWRKKSDYLSDLKAESESEQSVFSGNSFCSSPVTGRNYSASYMAPTVSSRMSGIEVPSKYMQQDHPSRRRTNATAVADSSSPKKSSSSSFMLKNAIKRSSSGIDQTTATMNTNTNKWGSSPGRTGSTSPNVKPPTSPSKGGKGGVGTFLSMGLELLKGKKGSTNVVTSSPLGLSMGENVHQLRLLHNRLVQWRYANAKAETANGKTYKKIENNLKYGWDAITKLQESVREKKLQIEKEKLEMKLYHILQSQIKALESWGDMEREHLSSVNMTKDCLHSVVCRVPLTEGAKVALESASIVLRDASDFTASINLMLSDFLHVADKTAGIFAELAEIVTQEKLLLEECLELFKFISDLEVKEKEKKKFKKRA